MSKAKTKVAPHVFTPDADLADPRLSVQVCRTCQLVGKPGDSHHTMPEPVPDVAGLAAGEGAS